VRKEGKSRRENEKYRVEKRGRKKKGTTPDRITATKKKKRTKIACPLKS